MDLNAPTESDSNGNIVSLREKGVDLNAKKLSMMSKSEKSPIVRREWI